MDRPEGVFEPIDRQHRRTLFSFLGIPVSFTNLAPLNVPLTLVGVLPIAWALKREEGVGAVGATAVRLMATVVLSNFLHSLGHLLAGRLVRAPMDELIVTATRHITAYHGDQSRFPTSVHVTRAMGGPVGNALVALAAALGWTLTDSESDTLRDLTLVNAGLALMALLPIKSGDGGSVLDALSEGESGGA